jgi:hypothetical protein
MIAHTTLAVVGLFKVVSSKCFRGGATFIKPVYPSR